MSITVRARKILWARSGNRCAICRCELVMDATTTEEESVIGEECHIVAHESDGPRGQHPLPLKHRDDLRNLILLCRNHHKEIDDQPNAFTVEKLKGIRARHEPWVRESLTNKKKAGSAPFFASRVDSGTQLCNSVMSCDAFHFSNDQPLTLDEVQLIGDFSQDIQDYLDLWSAIESKDRVSAQFEFDKQVKDLRENGFLVYATHRRERLISQTIEQHLELIVAYIIVLRQGNPLAERKDNEIERLMCFSGQDDSEFTNFIPVTCGSSGVE